MSDQFIPPHPLNTAVLFIVFKRPDTTKQVFESIRSAKPPRLYIASDGARETQEGEEEKVKNVREYVLSSIDWKCEVKTLFHEINLGPMHAQVAALNWFFEQEDEGIILEDDCLPDQSFFYFSDELLELYRNDKRIVMISGNNFQEGQVRGNADYYFSVYTHIWGWATWRRAWMNFDQDIRDWPEFKKIGGLENLHMHSPTIKYWTKIFDEIYSGKYKKGWDYRFLFSCWRENGLVIIPQNNLVKNIGFGKDATNCANSNSPFANMHTQEIRSKLMHPTIIIRNIYADDKTSRELFSNSLIDRIFYCINHPSLCFKKIISKIEGLFQ